MTTATPHPGRVQFGVFEVDLRSGELRKSGRKVHLAGQPFDLLALLLERPGEVVTREELREQLWPRDVFVDFDQSLNKAVNKVREALGDSADSPRFVETLGLWARRAGSPLLPGRRALLVVLPFQNLSGHPDEDYFSDGLTEEMIAQLGSLQPARLGVIARTSATQCKGAQKAADRIARELGVDYILEGSVRRDAGRVRIPTASPRRTPTMPWWCANAAFEERLSALMRRRSSAGSNERAMAWPTWRSSKARSRRPLRTAK